ncbi:helix-turn-helix domain protein [Candidatus Protofrankia californiensis]|uniref:Helix-turn-helix domain protein n=1 Tax=Candidatus Protofrankia californiensis TaxID=1839754 RepID=A0A1C3NYI9_9ACTN|nr:helix-turn-helix domain protein [Candidatus Protofrankia californiensis]
MTNDDARRRELGAFLRAHRERLSPQRLGLPATPRRRTPGLRREEVAARAGLGLAWYSWLEQGRVTASRQVIESLARALLLDDDARRHALSLAGLYAPPAEERPEDVAGRLRPILDAWTTSPALLVDSRFDIVAWNRAYAALWTDPDTLDPRRRNLMWLAVADPLLKSVLADWEDIGKDLLAQFRAQADHDPEDVRVQEILGILESDTPELRHWWNCRSVREFNARTVTVRHPIAGSLRLVLSALRPVDATQCMIMLYTPATASDHALVAEIAVAAAGPASARPDRATARPRRPAEIGEPSPAGLASR